MKIRFNRIAVNFLIGSFRRGEIVFLSDNVVALSHVRDFISKEATTKSIQLTMNAEVTWEATEILLHHVHPLLLDMIHRRQRNALALALKEAATDQLALSDGDADWMTTEFRDIVQADKENQPSNNHQYTTVEQYQSTTNLKHFKILKQEIFFLFLVFYQDMLH